MQQVEMKFLKLTSHVSRSLMTSRALLHSTPHPSLLSSSSPYHITSTLLNMLNTLRLIPRTTARSLHTTSRALVGAAKGPTHTSRTTPGSASDGNTHPGYTRGDEPPSSKNPSEMSQPKEGSVPSR